MVSGCHRWQTGNRRQTSGILSPSADLVIGRGFFLLPGAPIGACEPHCQRRGDGRGVQEMPECQVRQADTALSHAGRTILALGSWTDGEPWRSGVPLAEGALQLLAEGLDTAGTAAVSLGRLY